MLPAAIVALAAVGVALALPNRYESEATLAVVQQQIAQTLVAPITTTTIADTVNAMTREILSRSRLLAIIEEFDLYAKERKNSIPEELLAAQMRKDLDDRAIGTDFCQRIDGVQDLLCREQSATCPASCQPPDLSVYRGELEDQGKPGGQNR